MRGAELAKVLASLNSGEFRYPNPRCVSAWPQCSDTAHNIGLRAEIKIVVACRVVGFFCNVRCESRPRAGRITSSLPEMTMALGTCRICGAGRIATDAPICRECGGWWPNPGLCSRLGALTKAVFGLATLALAAFWYFCVSRADVGFYVCFGLVGLSTLTSSIIRPYGGRPPR